MVKEAAEEQWVLVRASDAAETEPYEASDGDDSEGEDADFSVVLPPKVNSLRELWAVERTEGVSFYFLPVALAVGSLLYFTAQSEPNPYIAPALAAIIAIGCFFAREAVRTILPRLALVCAVGFAVADLRADILSTRTLAVPTVLELEGVVARAEFRANGSVRYTLRTDGASFDVIRFTERRPLERHLPGHRIAVRVRAEPPAGAIWPGGYDFAFWAWFDGRGAQGYALTPTKRLGGEASGVAALRAKLSERIREQAPGDGGALAAALLTGDRSGLSQDAQEAMRASGLAHVLAISGLHMALLTGLVFALTQRTMLFLFRRAVEFPVRKWAAATALGTAFIYLLLSGFAVSTQRAFVMVAVMLVAVMFDRRALTLRNVALAALVVLSMQPEAVFHPGFQMSFAAAGALISVYAAIRRRFGDRPSEPGVLIRIGKPVAALSLTSFVAGLATAPFAIHHFGQVAAYGLLANLLAMPIVSVVVMPLVVGTGLLLPFGLEGIPLFVLARVNDIVLGVAGWVASFGAWWKFGELSGTALAIISAGFVTLIVFRTSLRWIGLPAVALGILVPAFESEPIVVVRENGRIAVIGGCGPIFSSGNGRAFADRSIVRTFGGAACEKMRGWSCDRLGCAYAQEELTVANPKQTRALSDDCARADVIVGLEANCGRSRVVRIRQSDLEQTGAHIVRRKTDGAMIIEAAYPYLRPWTAYRHQTERATKPTQ